MDKPKPKHPGGRPTKLTPDVADRIVNAVRGGNYIEVAAAHAGINKETLYAWMKTAARHREEGRESPHTEFSNALQKALADAELRDVLLIGRAAETQWQAAAWRLERKNYQRWGRKERIEHSGDRENPIAVCAIDVKTLSDEKLKQLEEFYDGLPESQLIRKEGAAPDGEGSKDGEGEEEPAGLVPTS